MGMDQTVEQRTQIPEASGQERSIIALLQQLARGATGQLGDLSAMAGGQVGAPTGQDIELVAQSIGRAREIAQREAEGMSGQLFSQLREEMARGGQKGSSAEWVHGNMLSEGLQQHILNSIAGAEQRGAEALMNLPFRRAEMQLGANRELFNRIIGASQPALMSMLQARMGQGITTQTTNDPTALYKMFGELGGQATSAAAMAAGG